MTPKTKEENPVVCVLACSLALYNWDTNVNLVSTLSYAEHGYLTLDNNFGDVKFAEFPRLAVVLSTVKATVNREMTADKHCYSTLTHS